MDPLGHSWVEFCDHYRDRGAAVPRIKITLGRSDTTALLSVASSVHILILRLSGLLLTCNIRTAPANEIVRYKMVTNDAELHSPYVMGEPTDLDRRWLDLYDCKSYRLCQLHVYCVAYCTERCVLIVGMIGLTPSEKFQLSDPTPPTPMDPDTYPVMIQVFHNIHCLNNLRQAIWRDDYPFTLERLPNGRVNRTTNKALHLGKYYPTFVLRAL